MNVAKLHILEDITRYIIENITKHECKYLPSRSFSCLITNDYYRTGSVTEPWSGSGSAKELSVYLFELYADNFYVRDSLI